MIEVGIALSLVAVAVGLSVLRGLRLENELVVATIRAIVQMAAVAALIQLILLSLGWSSVFLFGMLGVAAFTSARRMRGVPSAYKTAMIAIGSATAVTLIVLFGTGAFPLEPRYLIPLSGMIIGNAMNAVSLAGTRLRDEVVDKALEVESRLALGVRARQALLPYVQKATTVALIPTMDSTKNVGLVFLPGAFVGMILAGASPREAAEVQLVVLFMLLGAVSIAGAVATWLLSRQLISPGERLSAWVLQPWSSGS